MLTLDNLPQVVLDCLAERISMSSHVSAVQLALAAPSLFAPCLHAVIRCSSFAPGVAGFIKLTAPDAVHLKPDDVGRLVALSSDPESDRIDRFLVLPLRTHERTMAALPPESDRSWEVPAVAASLTWSLLRVPLAQIRAMDIDVFLPKSRWLLVPPFCARLSVTNTDTWNHIALPSTLTELHLCDVEVGPSFMNAFSAWTPRSLRKLALSEVVDAGDGELLTAFIKSIPPTITSLDTSCVGLHMDGLPEWEHVALADLIRPLPSLKHLGLGVGSGLPGLDEVMHALPRSGFSSLSLTLGSSTDAQKDRKAVGQLVASLPTSVGSFALDGLSLKAENAQFLAASLPLATFKLRVFFSDWTASMCRKLPMAPTLRELIVDFRTAHSNSFAQLFSRLPGSLEKLLVSCWLREDADIRMHNLARNMPLRLKSLTLVNCGLVASDLDVLDPVWPTTLISLDLSDNRCERGPIGLPSGLKRLNLNANPLRDNLVRTWVMTLPKSLSKLELDGAVLRESMESALLERMPVWESSWRRMAISNLRRNHPFREQLAARFDVC